MTKPTQYIVRNNLIILLALAVVLGLAARIIHNEAIFLFGFGYLGQALFNFIMGFVHLGRGPEDVGAAPYFLSTLLVLIIGFGACSGIFLTSGSLGNMH